MQAKSQQQGANGQGVEATAIAENARAALSREYHNFIADIEDLVKATALLSGEELARAKAKLIERVATAKQAAGEAGDAVVSQARRSAVATNDYVHEQPWQAIGIGAALGFLIGLLATRRT